MLKNLLTEAHSHLTHFFQEVDLSSLEKIVELCSQNKGLLVFTGVGKSGIIAEKIAATLTSTGTRAISFPSANFLHGDIGILSEGDILFMLSKSGESDELVNLIPFVQQRKVPIIGVVSSKNSRLAKSCDLCMFLPVQKELCSFDLVPTTSSQVQLIFGDILAIALMKNRQFNLEHYVLNHPSGTIGKKMTLSVKDLMISGKDLPLCNSLDKLADVLVELTHKKCGALIVANEKNELEGIFTDGDLRRALQTHGSDVLHQSVSNLMTATPISVTSQTLAWDAMKTMQKNPSKWVMVTPVVENNRVVGILRMHDIIQAGIV